MALDVINRKQLPSAPAPSAALRGQQDVLHVKKLRTREERPSPDHQATGGRTEMEPTCEERQTNDNLGNSACQSYKVP